jgi:hypothetical protein
MATAASRCSASVAGRENNWISTAATGTWFVTFRLYGRDEACFDKGWKPPDIEPMN